MEQRRETWKFCTNQRRTMTRGTTSSQSGSLGDGTSCRKQSKPKRLSTGSRPRLTDGWKLERKQPKGGKERKEISYGQGKKTLKPASSLARTKAQDILQWGTQPPSRINSSTQLNSTISHHVGQ